MQKQEEKHGEKREEKYAENHHTQEAEHPLTDQVDQIDRLPETKDGQIRRECRLFFSYFEEKQAEQMKEILQAGRYIPQEILNISDL